MPGDCIPARDAFTDEEWFDQHATLAERVQEIGRLAREIHGERNVHTVLRITQRMRTIAESLKHHRPPH